MPTLTCKVESVDYGGGRGHIWAQQDINVSVSGSTISVSRGEYRTNDSSWWICNSYSTNYDQYHLEYVVQYSYDGSNWFNLTSPRGTAILGPCANYDYRTGTNTKDTMAALCQSESFTVSASGYIRALFYAAGSASTPSPTPTYPYAYPNSSYSEASQAPIYIVTDYRPGEIRNGGTWKSHNRSGGHADIRRSGGWVEMRTEAGTGNPPSIRRDGSWENQAKIGAE